MAADGTIHTEQFTILIEQNLVTDELTDITITPTSISQFVIYSHDDLTINSKVSINGVIGTNSGITLADIVSSGWKSTVNGDIWANGTVTSNAEAELNGDIYAPGGISLGWAGNHTGEFHADISVPFITIPSKTIPVSEDNITIGFQEERLLVPGSYGDIIMSDGSSLILSAGVYNLNTLLLNSNGITVYCDIQPGEVVELNVNENLQLGSEAGFLFTNKFSPASLKIHTNQFSELSIPYASKVNGTITAPNTTVRINSGSIIYGAIYARKVDIGYDVTIIRPPFLTDIWHSEWAYSPPFDINQMNYTGVLPLNTNSVDLDYQVLYPDLTVLINNDPDLTTLPIYSGNEQVLFTVTDLDGISSDYTLALTSSSNSVIYVDATPAGTGNSGTSWAAAYSSLQDAVDDAVQSGKEIWLAEGVYTPTRQNDITDPRTKTFLLPQGIEILGGFDGTETEKDPQGSAYITTLSGDIDQNDGTAFSSLPFSGAAVDLVDDNSYHVVTINGINRANSTRLKGVTISGGVADGPGDHSYGGGVFSKYAHPAIEECAIRDNYAVSHGGGIYAGGGLQSFDKTLFENNTSLSGHGGALYINSSNTINLERVVFANNRALGENSDAVGGAIFANNCSISFLNSIFYGNTARFTGGMIYGVQSDFTLNHCTATNNSSTNGNGGISLIESSAAINNSILWSNDGETEGGSVNITYSCITNGHSGTGNIADNPSFSGITAGTDGLWGTQDDGLRIFSSSPCVDAADPNTSLEEDLIFTLRPLRNGYDMGAYEVPLPSSRGNVQLGFLTANNEFVTEDGSVIQHGLNHEELRKLTHSRGATTIQVHIEKNKHTRDINSAYGDVRFYDEQGNCPGSVRVWFYRNGETGSHYLFTSQKASGGNYTQGRPILLVLEPELATGADPDYYAIPATTYGRRSVTIPTSQF